MINFDVLHKTLRDFLSQQSFKQLQAVNIWHDIDTVDQSHPVYGLSRPANKKRFRRTVRLIGWGCVSLIGCPLALMAFPLLGFVVIMVNTFGAMQIAAIISGKVNQYHASERYDLIAITPDGGSSILWLSTLGMVQHTATYIELTTWRKYVPRIARWIPVALGVLIGLFYLWASIVDSDYQHITLNGVIAYLGWWGLAIIGGFVGGYTLHYDNFASIGTAVLTGLIIPRWIRPKGVSQGAAQFTMLVLQGGTYGVAMFTVGVIGSIFDAIAMEFGLYQSLPDSVTTAAILIYVIVMLPLCLILTREFVVRVLSYIYQRQIQHQMGYNRLK